MSPPRTAKPCWRNGWRAARCAGRSDGIHPVRLRKHLKAARLVTEDQSALSDNNIRIDAKTASEITRQIEGTLPLAEAMTHINAPRSQMEVLVKARIVVPQQNMADFGARDRYSIADLDLLMARLTAEAGRAKARDVRFQQIPIAAKRGRCSAATVVRLILGGKVRTRKSADQHGYRGILVDTEAVLRAVRPPTIADAQSLRKAALAIGTSDRVLNALIAARHVASFVGVNPVTHCRQTLVADKEVARFKAKYVSLWKLARERRMYIATLRKKLDCAGAKPAFDEAVIGARFYVRRDVKT
jgi:hypothetical protein